MAEAREKIEKIGKIERSEGKAGTLDAAEMMPDRMPPNRERFEGIVAEGKAVEGVSGQNLEEKARQTLMEQISTLNNQVERAKHGSPDMLIAQAAEVVDQIDKLKRQLNRPDLQLKGSVQTLLRNRLEHIDDNLKVALTRAGVEYTPETQNAQVVNPVERFFGMLTNGQHNLETLTQNIQQMAANKASFSPADMLFLQVKVATIQQEIEFFTNILNKGLESTKTIMNVQV